MILYKKKEIINNNVRFIMPKIISDVHNDLIKSLYVGKSKSMSKLITNFIKNKKNIYVPVYTILKSLPWLHQSGINFISLIIVDT